MLPPLAVCQWLFVGQAWVLPLQALRAVTVAIVRRAHPTSRRRTSLQRLHVAELGVHIEQVPRHDSWHAVAHGLLDDDRAEALGDRPGSQPGSFGTTGPCRTAGSHRGGELVARAGPGVGHVNVDDGRPGALADSSATCNPFFSAVQKPTAPPPHPAWQSLAESFRKLLSNS